LKPTPPSSHKHPSFNTSSLLHGFMAFAHYLLLFMEVIEYLCTCHDQSLACRVTSRSKATTDSEGAALAPRHSLSNWSVIDCLAIIMNHHLTALPDLEYPSLVMLPNDDRLFSKNLWDVKQPSQDTFFMLMSRVAPGQIHDSHLAFHLSCPIACWRCLRCPHKIASQKPASQCHSSLAIAVEELDLPCARMMCNRSGHGWLPQRHSPWDYEAHDGTISADFAM